MHGKAAGIFRFATVFRVPQCRQGGKQDFGWGRSSVHLLDRNLAKKTSRKKERMIRLRFGIGFAKPIYPGRAAITPANLASSLAEFSLIYNPATEKWTFGK